MKRIFIRNSDNPFAKEDLKGVLRQRILFLKYFLIWFAKLEYIIKIIQVLFLYSNEYVFIYIKHKNIKHKDIPKYVEFVNTQNTLIGSTIDNLQ